MERSGVDEHSVQQSYSAVRMQASIMIDFMLFYECISCQYFPRTPWIACGHDSPGQHVTDIDGHAQTSASALIAVTPSIAHAVQVLISY